MQFDSRNYVQSFQKNVIFHELIQNDLIFLKHKFFHRPQPPWFVLKNLNWLKPQDSFGRFVKKILDL